MKLKLCHLFLLSIISTCSYGIIPITSFVEGSYLSIGSFITSSGQKGTTSSYVIADRIGLKTVLLYEGSLHFLKSNLLVDNFGFITGYFIDDTDVYNPIVHIGYGHCGTSWCQLSVPFEDGYMQQLFRFNSSNKSIQVSGAITYNDSRPKLQWEEFLFWIPPDNR